MMLATAESCTGGWISEAVTMVPGSSDWFERGFVTYTYISKREMLGVREATLEKHGAVAEEVVREMAEGALARSHAQIAVAVSGIAGPSGGTPEKPVGTVWLAARYGFDTYALLRIFPGDRGEIRARAAQAALDLLRRLLGGKGTR